MYWKQPVGFEDVFSQHDTSGAGVKHTVDRAYTRRGEAKTDGSIVIRFCKEGDTIGNFKRADLCIRFLGRFSEIGLCFLWRNSVFAVLAKWRISLITIVSRGDSILFFVPFGRNSISVHYFGWVFMFISTVMWQKSFLASTSYCRHSFIYIV